MKDASYVQNLRLGDIDPDLHWQGPEDMSGTLYAAWDTDNLYIAFSAADDIHFQQRKDEGIWEGDSIQIAIALVCSPERPQADVELGLALTGTDTCLHYWTGGLTVKPEYTVIRTGVNTLYGIAVPWKGLQYSPVRCNVIFLSVLLNDNDGRGRKSILEWGRGIHGKKYVELFRPLILNE